MLTKSRINNNIWVIKGDTEEEIPKAFVRFQEFYENKDLKGKRDITVVDVEAWWDQYKVSLDTEDSYYQYWAGFNIPGKIILELIRDPMFRNCTCFNSYNNEETELLQLIKDIPLNEIYDGYFIGMWWNAECVLDHEIAHALFSTNPAYMLEQRNNISKLPANIYAKIRNHLSQMGYNDSVIHDEIQAYFSTYVDGLEDTFETPIYNSYTKPFVDTFNRFHNMPS